MQPLPKQVRVNISYGGFEVESLMKKEKDLMEFYGWNRSQLHKKLIRDRHEQVIRP